MDEKGKMEAEITNRIAQFAQNTGALYPILRDKYVPKKVKVHICSTILKPILTYSSETLVLTERLKNKIQAAEMRTLLLIYGVTKRDHIRNINIRLALGVESIISQVEKNQLRWYGHIKRCEDQDPSSAYWTGLRTVKDLLEDHDLS